MRHSQACMSWFVCVESHGRRQDNQSMQKLQLSMYARQDCTHAQSLLQKIRLCGIPRVMGLFIATVIIETRSDCAYLREDLTDLNSYTQSSP